MSSKQLPPEPNLRNLKNQAKRLLKAYQADSSHAVDRIKDSNTLPSGAVLDPAGFTLQDAQLVLAREYGFSRWQDLVVAVNQANPQPDPASASVDMPFTLEEVKAALSYMGVHMERFHFDGSESCDIDFYIEHYIGGKKEAEHTGTMRNNRAGENTLLLFMSQKEDDTINFALQCGSHRFGLGDIPLKGRNTRAWDRLIQDPIPSGKAVAIFVVAAQKQSIHYQSGKSVEEIIAQYEMVVIILVEIRQKTGGT